MPGRREEAQSAISGKTIVSFAAMHVWPSSPFDGASWYRFHSSQMRVQVRTDRIKFGPGPPAGHDAQQVAELRPEPGLDSIPVGGSDHKHGLVLAGPEGGHRDGGAGVSQVAEVVVQVVLTTSPCTTSPIQVRPAPGGGRAWRRVPARVTVRRVLGNRLAYCPELIV